MRQPKDATHCSPLITNQKPIANQNPDVFSCFWSAQENLTQTKNHVDIGKKIAGSMETKPSPLTNSL